MRTALVALSGVLLLLLCYLAAQAGIIRLRSDFWYYYVAGRMVLAGLSPHDPDAWPARYLELTGTRSADQAFPYPPWTVLPTLPLALLDPAWAATLWVAISLGTLGTGALLVLKDVPPARRPHATGIGVVALAGFVPTVEALFFGQLSPLLTAALLGACALARSGHRTLAVVLLTVLLLKPQLGLVTLPVAFVHLIRHGECRAAALLCLSCLGIMLLSAPWLSAWITHLGPALQTNAADAGHTPTVYGLSVLLGRSTGASVAVAAALALAAAALGPVGASLRQRHGGQEGLAEVLRIATPASLALAPYLWTYDLSLLLACLLPACRDLLARPGRHALGTAWALATGSTVLSWLLLVLAALHRRETPSLILPFLFAAVAWMVVLRPGGEPVATSKPNGVRTEA